MLTEEYHKETLRYLAISDPAHRQALGQFFTPRSLREKLLSHVPRLARPRVLDPACGTGEFLLSAREHFVEPELHCWEVDPALAEVARRVVSGVHLKVTDSLREPFREEFDVVLGNPPYFELRLDEDLAERYREVTWGRANIYTLFVYLGLRLLRPGGYLAYVISSSMDSGAYFRRLREYIVKVADVEYLKVLDNPHLFDGVTHTFQLLVLRKRRPGERPSGRYIFYVEDRLILSDRAEDLKRLWLGSVSLRDMGYRVATGRVVWNRNRERLTDDSSGSVMLIWAHNIGPGKLRLGSKPGKPQYIRWPGEADVGPAVVVRRVIGHPRRARLMAALVPPGMKFVAENHVNVIYPPPDALPEELEEVVRWLNSPEVQDYVRGLIGNTQVSARELERLIPVPARVAKGRQFSPIRQGPRGW